MSAVHRTCGYNCPCYSFTSIRIEYTHISFILGLHAGHIYICAYTTVYLKRFLDLRGSTAETPLLRKQEVEIRRVSGGREGCRKMTCRCLDPPPSALLSMYHKTRPRQKETVTLQRARRKHNLVLHMRTESLVAELDACLLCSTNVEASSDNFATWYVHQHQSRAESSMHPAS